MLIIPAIDVSDGRLGRLDAGRVVAVESFGGDPLSAAAAFVGAGVTWLHVVDLDLAFTGRPAAGELIAAIAALGVSVQASGGLTSRAHVQAMLDAGASRAVLGSGALSDPEEVADLIATFADRLAVGVEAEGGFIRPRGRWGQPPETELALEPAVSTLFSAGVRRLVVTDVDRVGARGGVGGSGLSTVLTAAPGVPVIASGGVGVMGDLEALADLGVEGAIVGSAVYHGDIDVAAAVHRFRGGA